MKVSQAMRNEQKKKKLVEEERVKEETEEKQKDDDVSAHVDYKDFACKECCHSFSKKTLKNIFPCPKCGEKCGLESY